jgi:hypothetical protein
MEERAGVGAHGSLGGRRIARCAGANSGVLCCAVRSRGWIDQNGVLNLSVLFN